MRRRHLLSALPAALVSRPGWTQSGSSGSWPERPIRVVVPYAPGGSTDTGARALGERLEKILGQPIVVENKAGGGTIIGTETVAKSKADGYTILLATGALAVNAAFDMTLPYDTYRDLTPVAHFFDVPILVAAHPDAPFKSMSELLAMAKGQGAPISYASASGGSMQHLWAELLKMQLGLRIEHVGYKGSSEAVRDVMGGHVPLLVDLLVPTGAAVKSGKLRGLAVAMPQRAPLLPDVPTMREAGVNGLEGAIFNGFMAPAATPSAAVNRLNQAINQALGDPDLRKRLTDMGFNLIGGTSEQFGQTLAKETATWRKVIKEARIPAPA
jgi:tripartite-type tricarboxylate transporter receptor subunit TctC